MKKMSIYLKNISFFNSDITKEISIHRRTLSHELR